MELLEQRHLDLVDSEVEDEDEILEAEVDLEAEVGVVVETNVSDFFLFFMLVLKDIIREYQIGGDTLRILK